MLLVLLACSSGEGDQARSSSELVIWQFWHPDLLAPIVDRFAFEYPGLRVVVEQVDWAQAPRRLATAIAAGTAPDLCEMSSTWLPRFAAGGDLADLTRQADPLLIRGTSWDAVRFDGRILALPWLANARLLFVNRQLLRDADLPTDPAPETWADLLHAAASIDSLDEEVHGFGMPGGELHLLHKMFLPFAAGNGGRVLAPGAGHAVIDSLPVIEALEFLVALSDHALRAPQRELDEAFMGGRLGMQVASAATLALLRREAPELDFDVVPVPGPGPYAGTHASFADLTVIAVLGASPHVDAAIEFARYMMEPDNVKRFCRAALVVQPALPATIAGSDHAASPREARFAEAVAQALMPAAHPRWTEISEAVDQAVEDALARRMEPASALDGAARRIDRLLEDAP